MEQKKYIKLIDFFDLSLWDLKRLFLSPIKSKYNIIYLKEIIIERKEKEKLYEYPEKTFWILWVNNKVWVFDAYIEKWKNINQAYKKVYEWDLAYNPYRVNVWSIWLKTNKNKFNYISPAYVVLSCNMEKLLPDYLYILLKTDYFNKIINENTTGSVRQNLKFSTLKEIKIPLPSLAEQNKIVEVYKNKLQQAEESEKKAKIFENEIESYLMEELAIQLDEKKKTGKGLQFFEFKDLERWDLFKNFGSSKSKKYKNWFLKDIIIWSPMYWSNVSWVKKKSDTRYIRITDINESWELNDDFVSPRSVDEKFLLQENDFLMARSWNTVWKTFLYTENFWRAIFAWYLVKYKLDLKQVNPKFILFYTKSLNYKKWIEANQRIVWQPNINGQEYLFSPIILPPLEIQNKIVQHISELKSKIKKLKELSEKLKNSANSDFAEDIFS